MTTSAEIKAGAAYVELYLKDGRFARGLTASGKLLTAWGGSVARIGASVMAVSSAMVGAIALAAKQFADVGDSLDKMSTRIGVSVEFLGALSYAAQIGGTDITAMEVGFRRLQRTAYDASRGLSTAVDAFGDLGVEIRGVDGQLKSTEQLFMESASAISAVENNTKKAALATIIFGRAGTSLLPMLKEGAQGLRAVMEEAHKLNLVLSPEDITAAAVLTDAWLRLSSTMKMVTTMIGAAVAPMFSDLADRLAKNVAVVSNWIDRHRSAVVSMLKLGVAGMAAGAAIMVLGGGVIFAGMALTGLAGILSAVGSAVGVLATVIAAITSPIGLVVAAVLAAGVGLAALAGYALYASGALSAMASAVRGGLGRALAYLSDGFKTLWKDASKAFEGISDALASGDYRLAAEIVWRTIVLEFERGKLEIMKLWLDLKDQLQRNIIGKLAIDYMARQFRLAVDGMRMAVRLLTQELGRYMRAFEAMVTLIGPMLDRISPDLRQALTSKTEPPKRTAAEQAYVDTQAGKVEAVQRQLDELNRRANAQSRRDPSGRSARDESGPSAFGPDENAMAWTKKWEDRLHQLKIDNIEDEQKRAIARINSRYDREKSEAKDAGREVTQLEKARDKELAATRRRFQKQEAQEQAEYSREQAADRDQLEYDIERQRISNVAGPGRERALLNLEKRRALEGVTDDEARRMINQLYALRSQGLQAGGVAGLPGQQGSFSAFAASRFGGRAETIAERTAKATERTANNTARLIRADRRGGLPVGRG